MRTIVDLPQEQLTDLAEICRREGISRAEAIRRAVRMYTHKHCSRAAHKAFGIWKTRKIDGLEYEAALRQEWEEPRNR